MHNKHKNKIFKSLTKRRYCMARKLLSVALFLLGFVGLMLLPFTFGASGAIALFAFLLARILDEKVAVHKNEKVLHQKLSGKLTCC